MSAKKINVRELPEVQKLVDRVNSEGLEATAKAYDTHPSTLSRWLNKNGYEVVRRYELTPAGQEAMANA